MYSISYPSGTLRKHGIVFPQDAANATYQEYAAWVAADNGPEVLQDVVARPVIVVNAWQLRRALRMAGLRDAVETAVAMSADQDVRDGWYHSPTFSSDEPMTLNMGAALGQDENAMYALFQLAGSLK